MSAVLVLTLTVAACSSGGGPVTLQNTTQRGSYALGVRLGADLASSPAEFDVDALVAGVRDVLEGRDPRLTDDEMAAAFQEFSEGVRATALEQQAQLGEANREEGTQFLLQNGQRDEVTILPSGLQYEIIEQGDGPTPAPTDQVRVHYTGTLIDGTEFDSSHRRGEPAVFVLNQVIPGWTEGLQLMPVGSKYKLYVPSNLGYGEAGQGGTIGPNATLIFEVELLEIL